MIQGFYWIMKSKNDKISLQQKIYKPLFSILCYKSYIIYGIEHQLKKILYIKLKINQTVKICFLIFKSYIKYMLKKITSTTKNTKRVDNNETKKKSKKNISLSKQKLHSNSNKQNNCINHNVFIDCSIKINKKKFILTQNENKQQNLNKRKRKNITSNKSILIENDLLQVPRFQHNINLNQNTMNSKRVKKAPIICPIDGKNLISNENKQRIKKFQKRSLSSICENNHLSTFLQELPLNPYFCKSILSNSSSMIVFSQNNSKLSTLKQINLNDKQYLISQSTNNTQRKRNIAATIIQKTFRGYLTRKLLEQYVKSFEPIYEQQLKQYKINSRKTSIKSSIKRQEQTTQIKFNKSLKNQQDHTKEYQTKEFSLGLKKQRQLSLRTNVINQTIYSNINKKYTSKQVSLIYSLLFQNHFKKCIDYLKSQLKNSSIDISQFMQKKQELKEIVQKSQQFIQNVNNQVQMALKQMDSICFNQSNYSQQQQTQYNKRNSQIYRIQLPTEQLQIYQSQIQQSFVLQSRRDSNSKLNSQYSSQLKSQQYNSEHKSEYNMRASYRKQSLQILNQFLLNLIQQYQQYLNSTQQPTQLQFLCQNLQQITQSIQPKTIIDRCLIQFTIEIISRGEQIDLIYQTFYQEFYKREYRKQRNDIKCSEISQLQHTIQGWIQTLDKWEINVIHQVHAKMEESSLVNDDHQYILDRTYTKHDMQNSQSITNIQHINNFKDSFT